MLANEWEAEELDKWGLDTFYKGVEENKLTEDLFDINEEFDPVGVSAGLQRVVFIFDGSEEAESYLNSIKATFVKRNMAWQVNMSTQSI
jgi:hypothetical protein